MNLIFCQIIHVSAQKINSTVYSLTFAIPQDEAKTTALTKKKEGTGYTPRMKRKSKKSHPIQYDSDDDFV